MMLTDFKWWLDISEQIILSNSPFGNNVEDNI